MGGGCLKNKFCLLLWKNYTVQKRHWIVTLFEIFLIPFVAVLVLFVIRLIGSVRYEDLRSYTEFDPGGPELTAVVDKEGKSIILYAPDGNPEVAAIMDGMKAQFDAPGEFQAVLSKYQFRPYADEGSLLQDFANKDEFRMRESVNGQGTNPVLAAITFSETSRDEISYRIRFPYHPIRSYGQWMTNLVFPAVPENRERDGRIQHGRDPFYWADGFLFLQSAVDKAIIQHKTGQRSGFEVVLNRFPYPEHTVDYSVNILKSFLPKVMVVSFFYAVANIAKAIVWEKERRLKEAMKMMGLPGWLHWMAWLTKSFILHSFSVVLMTLLLTIPIGEMGILTHADGSLVFCFLLAYLFSAISFGFMVGSFCSRANWATIIAIVLFFVTCLPFLIGIQGSYNEVSAGAKIGWSFLNNCGLGIGCYIIALFEGTGTGVQWSNIAHTATPDEDISLLTIMGMLLLDGFIYLFLAVYIEAVFPGEFGVPLPWYFPCVPCYWFGTKNKVHPDSSSSNNVGGFFEKEPENATIGIQIMGLRKVFGKKVAVDGLELKFYENQVTTLLGHNGAGKTTVMSMLTGIYQPTSGTALVNGFDIRTDMRSVRKSLGLCPQHNVLFDELTVEEHLKFFCLLKGYDQPVQPEIDKMVAAIGLEDKREAESKTLSGGMKRKLSIGIAFIGGSKVVLLDEPTAGLDPGARRGVWDIISKEKNGRTILLSTHFMDEAELLGDRIAILANGRVACCGSPLFLKQKYGGGYHLIIVKEPHSKVDLITQLLQKSIPEVKVDQNIGTELSYSLPEGKVSVFPEMFEELEKRKAELGISSYGCSITQMEEVFMRVEEQLDIGTNEKKNASVQPMPSSSSNIELIAEQSGSRKSRKSIEARKSGSKVPSAHEVDIESNNGPSRLPSSKNGMKIDEPLPIPSKYPRNKGCSLFLQQFRAMFVKKCIYAMRSWIFFSFQALLIVVILGLALWAMPLKPESLKDSVEMRLDLRKFDNPVTTIECKESRDICQAYKSVAQSQSHVENIGTLKFEDFILGKAGKDNANQPEVNARYIVGLQVEESSPSKLKGYFNNQPYHSPPIALNFISNSILRTVTNNSGFKLSVSNYPLPYRDQEKKNFKANKTGGLGLAPLLLILTSLFMASFIMFPVKERAGKAKHLQFVSGAQYAIFWLGHLTFDGLFNLFVSILMVVVAIIFPVEPLSSGSGYLLFFLILLLHGWAALPVTYLFSLLFANPSTGYTLILMIYLVGGVVGHRLASSLAVRIGARVVFLDLVPSYGMFSSVNTLGTSLEWCGEGCGVGDILIYEHTEWGAEQATLGNKLLVLFIGGLIYFGLLCLVESNILRAIFRCCCEMTPVTNDEDPTTLEDSDVAAENERIRETDLNQLFVTDNMVLKDLTKHYGTLFAVEMLCLGVQHGECFGLLGVNGAGKTTTFKMLTGEITISSGDAYITGKSVTTELKEVYKVIGYCPQFDALLPELTGRETIRMFARLRGIPESEINGLVDRLAVDLKLEEHLSKPCGTYSGGNKRKLSAAIALVGNPQMVFLDEPTAGMDPVARRYLWNAVIKVREGGASVILTSHSMDECEALCTKLAIMVAGKFRCLGSPQHLKNKFGDGFTIIAQLPSSSPNELPEQKRRKSSRKRESKRHSSNLPAEPWKAHLQPLRDFIESNFKGCELKDMHPCYVHYHIKMNPTISWPQLFRKMEEAKALFKLEAYSVGQTSLEQVFLGFSKGHWNTD